jgi:predicted pyridoxine 5'-phosphate oxidase superfamily flavin-nucleotide-binding protein
MSNSETPIYGINSTVDQSDDAAMTRTPAPTSDVAFTPTVKAIQLRKGSRGAYVRLEEHGGFDNVITPELAAFVTEQRSFFLATANAEGQPYIQHRGGPAGFLHVVDERTLAFVDFKGNRQFITQGNLSDNPRAFIFLIDFATRRRIKLWGTARIVEDDAELLRRLMPAGYQARAEQIVLFTVTAWDENCPQHIPQRFDAADVARELEERDRRIAELEAELAELRSALHV